MENARILKNIFHEHTAPKPKCTVHGESQENQAVSFFYFYWFKWDVENFLSASTCQS